MMQFDDHHGLTILKIRQRFNLHNVDIISEEDMWDNDYGATTILKFSIRNHNKHHTLMLSEMADIQGIKNIKQVKKRPASNKI